MHTREYQCVVFFIFYHKIKTFMNISAQNHRTICGGQSFKRPYKMQVLVHMLAYTRLYSRPLWCIFRYTLAPDKSTMVYTLALNVLTANVQHFLLWEQHRDHKVSRNHMISDSPCISITSVYYCNYVTYALYLMLFLCTNNVLVSIAWLRLAVGQDQLTASDMRNYV